MRQLIILIPVVLLLAGCHEQVQLNKVADETIPVKVMQLVERKGATVITASGQFTTDDEAYLSFKNGGLIDRIYVKEGDLIQKNQLLATLKMTEIDAQVQQAKLACEKAERDYERTSNLYKDSVATLEQLQNSKTMQDIARQQLEAAQFNRSYSEIRASKSGYVLRKIANEGQQVGPGTPVFQTNGAGNSTWLLRVGVSDQQWASIGIHSPAIVHVDAGNGTIAGEVIRKSQGVDPNNGLFTIDIRVGGKPGVAAGMFGRADIRTSDNGRGEKNTWEIPYDALLDADGSMGYVFVVEGNTVIKTRVVIAGMEKDRVIITDGLQNAKAIVTTGNAYLMDKSAIRIIQ